MEQWQPNTDELKSTFQVLQALRNPTCADHIQAMQGLDSFCLNSSFVLHVLYIFVRGQSIAPADIRALGGFILKNYVIAKLGQHPAHVLQSIKAELLCSLQDTVPEIQNTTSIIFGKLTQSYPVEYWGDILPSLFSMLDYQALEQATTLDGALQAVKRICEDSCEKLLTNGPVTAANVTSPLDILVPKLLVLFQHQIPTIRLRAVQSMNALLSLLANPIDDEEGGKVGNDTSSSGVGVLGHGREAFIIHINSFLSGISQLAQDKMPEIRLAVCQAIVNMASYQLAVLQPAYQSICSFMLTAIRDTTESVAMEACEFFAVLCCDHDARGTLVAVLPALLPQLVGLLRLSEQQLLQERADEEATARGDKALNLKPIHHKAKNNNQSSDDDDDSNDGADMGIWTLRKQAALLIDNLSTCFHPQLILPNTLPEIQSKLSSTDVWDREAAMLALGALGTGCISSMEPYLPQLFPFFLNSVRDEMLEMRSIACWVISRYCGWLFASDEATEEVYNLINSSIKTLFSAMTDTCAKVQTAACSALCTVIDYAGDQMTPFVPEMLTIASHCFGRYGLKSLMTLFDVIGVLADQVGDALDDDALTPLYLPFIMSKLESLDDSDMYLFPILECLTSVTVGAGRQMIAFAPSLFIRCLRIATNTMSIYARANALATTDATAATELLDDAPVKDFVICSLDVICGLVEGLGIQFEELLRAADHSNSSNGNGTISTMLVQLLFLCMQDALPECRQSAFSLTGELCHTCPNVLRAHVNTILTYCVQNITDEEDLVWACNNACWTIGEIAVNIGGEAIASFIGRILQAHMFLLRDEARHINLKQNLAITVGRLGVTNTAQVSEILPEFFEDFCTALKCIANGDERDQAFMGLLSVIHAKPQIILCTERAPKAFMYACASWEEPSDNEQVMTQLATILSAIKTQYHAQWVAALRSMDAELVARFLDVFRIN